MLRKASCHLDWCQVYTRRCNMPSEVMLSCVGGTPRYPLIGNDWGRGGVVNPNRNALTCAGHKGDEGFPIPHRNDLHEHNLYSQTHLKEFLLYINSIRRSGCLQLSPSLACIVSQDAQQLYAYRLCPQKGADIDCTSPLRRSTRIGTSLSAQPC